MKIIHLPDRVQFSELFEFQAFLSRESLGQSQLVFDFGAVVFYEYAAIGLLLSHIHGLKKQNVTIDFQNFQERSAFAYFQRINFFEHCDFRFEENFNRHAEAGRFVPLYRVGRGGHHDSDQVAKEIAGCLFPDLADSDELDETGVFDWVEYSVSELIRNVSQHSRSFGFAGAQFYPGTDSVQIVVADCGVGILKSFEETGSRFFNPGMDDLLAVRKALEPKVSSRDRNLSWGGEVENAGVGLTVTVKVVSETGGSFIVSSGKAFVTDATERWFGQNEVLNGTFCALLLNQTRIGNFYDLLRRVLAQIDPLPPTGETGRYFK